MTTHRYYRTLTIAGSDSGGGAGIQADLKTFSALGCYGMSVITALTAQNTTSVAGVHAPDPVFTGKQIDAVMQDIGADAVKIGMLFSAGIIREVAEKLARYQPAHVVLDPVMVAKSGDKLLQDEAIDALVELLFPISTLITPNIPEAELLSGVTIENTSDFEAAAATLVGKGAQNVLIKGGHLTETESTDVLFLKTTRNLEKHVFAHERIQSQNTHGTGCTYSSAIAAFLARGHSLPDSVERAKDYLQFAIKKGAEYKIGMGHGPVHHFYKFW